MGTYERLYAELCKLPVIDTHEHLTWKEQEREHDKHDVLSEYMLHYLSSDVMSAGLPSEDYARVCDTSKDIQDRWALVEPYWEWSRYTGYGRSLDIAVQAIYGIERIDRSTIVELNCRYLEHKKVGHFRHVLHDLCNIEKSIVDIWTFYPNKPDALFHSAWQPQNYIQPIEPNGKDMLRMIEERQGLRVRSLDDWLQALDADLAWVIDSLGSRVLKCAIAYRRSLHFASVPHSRASELFATLLPEWEGTLQREGKVPDFPVELQDYMMHALLRLAGKRHMTLQLHTGLLEGNGNTLSNSNPSLLNNLFIAYPDVNFDLFHISYPYQGVAAALCKMFPNVFIDMCWAHIISPSACVMALHDFLDAIPYNKISAFGGDYLFVDGVYGHLTLSRQNVARVLSERIERGICGESVALDIARALYYDNPKRLFGL